MCSWTGCSCNLQGHVVTLSLACDTCNVKASGTLPPALSTLSQLTSLNLQYNDFYGFLPEIWAGLGQFPALQYLYLGNNSLSGEIPWHGSSFPQLQLLRLDGNRFSGSWPDSLNLPSLSVLRAYNNNFSGTLSPRLLDTVPQLQILSFQYNQLSGVLPPEWVNSPDALGNIREMYLQGNQFSGNLPAEWGFPPAFSNLAILNLDDNPSLGGKLPEAWGTVGAFPKLSSLKIDYCSFEGDLPPSWATPGADVSNNNLTGSVDNWQGMSSLKRLVISPGNQGLCTSSENAFEFSLCTATDPSCLVETPSLPSCEEAAAAAGADGDGSNGGSFPTVAVAVGLGVGTPLVMFLGCLFFVLLRKSKRIREIEAAQKRRGEQISHPFDTWEGQAALTSPFSGATAFTSSPVAVAPAARTSEETIPTTATPQNSSGGSSAHDSSIGSRFARVRACSFEYTRSGEGGRSSPPPASGSREQSAAAAAAPIGVALPQSQTPHTSTQSRTTPHVYPSTLELQPVRTCQASSIEGAAVVRGSGSSTAAGSLPRSSFETASPTGTASPNYSSGVLDLPFSDWEVQPNELEIIKRPDGTDWVLGRGAWGVVYKALRGGVQPVAVKELHIGRAGGGLQAEMPAEVLRNEIEILKHCRDRNIVMFLGAYLGPEKTLLVTEYMEGGDLMANIAAGRVTWWRRGRRIAIDVAKGLCFLHARRIAHFDLKSPNILLGRDGTAKIGDVGLARILARDYVTGVVGSLSWSAPELLFGNKCTLSADIWSFGIVLWEICTGEKPVRGQLRDVKVPEETSEDVRVLILECLDTRPSRRPSAFQIVERLRLQSPSRHVSATGEPSSVRYSGQRSSDEREREVAP